MYVGWADKNGAAIDELISCFVLFCFVLFCFVLFFLKQNILLNLPNIGYCNYQLVGLNDNPRPAAIPVGRSGVVLLVSLASQLASKNGTAPITVTDAQLLQVSAKVVSNVTDRKLQYFFKILIHFFFFFLIQHPHLHCCFEIECSF